MTRTATLIVLMICAALLASCTGQRAHPVDAPATLQMRGAPEVPGEPPAGIAALPSPGQLLAGTESAGAAERGTSYVEEDLYKDGDEYDPLLPFANVSPISPPFLDFTPSLPAQPENMTGLAYAIYRFQATDFDRVPRVSLAWEIEPALLGDCWVAVSNWDLDRWQWYRLSQNSNINFGSIDPMFNANDELLVVVAQVGSSPSQLARVYIGGRPPQPTFTMAPPFGSAPLEVHFDASASYPGEGSIVKYEWDFQDDGIFDEESTELPTATHVFDTAGTHFIALRVTNSEGLSAITSSKIEVNAFWQHSFGRSGADWFIDVLADSAGDLYLTGSTEDPALELVSHLAVFKLSATGELIWARSFAMDTTTVGYYIGEDTEGNLIVAGVQDGGVMGQSRCILLQWDNTGELLWSESLERGTRIYPQGLEMNGDDIYLAGFSSGDNTDFFAAQLEATDGSLDWDRTIGNAGGEIAAAMCLKYDALAGVAFGMSLIGTLDGTPDRPLRVDINLDGSQSDASQLEFTNEDLEDVNIAGRAIRFEDYMFGDSLYFIGGDIYAGSGACFVTSIPAAAPSTAGRRIEGLNYLRSIERDGSGDLLLSGIFSSGSLRGFLASLAPLTLAYENVQEVIDDPEVNLVYALPHGDGLLTWGKAPSNSPLIVDALHADSAVTTVWEEYDIDVVGDDVSINAIEGTVTDITDLLVVDSGGGAGDAFIGYYSAP